VQKLDTIIPGKYNLLVPSPLKGGKARWLPGNKVAANDFSLRLSLAGNTLALSLF
jgi:hypothetical protein